MNQRKAEIIYYLLFCLLLTLIWGEIERDQNEKICWEQHRDEVYTCQSELSIYQDEPLTEKPECVCEIKLSYVGQDFNEFFIRQQPICTCPEDFSHFDEDVKVRRDEPVWFIQIENRTYTLEWTEGWFPRTFNCTWDGEHSPKYFKCPREPNWYTSALLAIQVTLLIMICLMP